MKPTDAPFLAPGQAPADALAAVTHPDPYPYYATLAARPGLHFDAGLGLWIAAGAPSVIKVMEHADCRVRPLAEPVPAAIADGAAGQVFGALVRMNEGEAHARPKLALRRALGGVDLAVAHQRAAGVARRLWRRDALATWMFDAPVSAMASLIGFSDAQLPAVAAWMGEFVACLSPYSDAAQLGRAHLAAQAMLAQFADLLRRGQADVDEEGAAPASLLTQVIAEARAVGWDNAQALLANLVGLLSQTYEATAGLVGNSIIALARQPEDERSGPEDAATLVHAVSRFDPPVQNTRRFVARDCDIDGVRLQAGQVVLLVLAAASRDPQGGGHEFGFGYGVHACPGHALACAIAAGAMEALMEVLEEEAKEEVSEAPKKAAMEMAMAEARRPLLQTLAWTYRRSPNARIPVFTQAATQVARQVAAIGAGCSPTS